MLQASMCSINIRLNTKKLLCCIVYNFNFSYTILNYYTSFNSLSPKGEFKSSNGKRAQTKSCSRHEKGIISLVMNPLRD